MEKQTDHYGTGKTKGYVEFKVSCARNERKLLEGPGDIL
jgi:hypothetical protein